MSKNVTVEVEHVNKETILAGAKALGFAFNKQDNTIDLRDSTKQTFKAKVRFNGAITVDVWGMKDLDGLYITPVNRVSNEDNAVKYIAQYLRRAGILSQSKDVLDSLGYVVTSDFRKGIFEACRPGSGESININISLDGTIEYESKGFEGDACSVDLKNLIDVLSSKRIVKEESKTQPQQVITNITV